MKKLVGSILAGAVLLAPTAALADTVVGGSTSVVPIFVVGGSQTPPPAVDDQVRSLPVITGEQAKKLAEAEKKAAKDAAKDAKEQAEAAKKEAKEAAKDAKDARHELKVDDDANGSSPWSDASLVKNGGWKLS